MTQAKHVDPSHVTEVHEDLLAWLHAHHVVCDTTHEELRTLRFRVHRNQYLHLGLGVSVYAACVWSPPIYSAWRGGAPDWHAALTSLVVLGVSLHLLLRRFGRIHLELARRIDALECAYRLECLRGMKSLSWQQLQDLKRLRCILQANLTFDELERELLKLLEEPTFPSPQLKNALSLWLLEAKQQIQSLWPTPCTDQAQQT